MHDLDSLIRDPQVEALGMVRTIEGHPTVGPFRTIDVPWKFDEELTALRLPPPVLGQHTAELLAGFGYDDEAIAKLVEQGVIATWREAPAG